MFIKMNDFKPEISEELAHQKVSEAVVNFLDKT